MYMVMSEFGELSIQASSSALQDAMADLEHQMHHMSQQVPGMQWTTEHTVARQLQPLRS